MRSLYTYVASAAAAVAAAWWLVFSPRLELANAQLAHADQQLADAQRLDAERVTIIKAQTDQLGRVLLAEQQNRELLAQIASLGRAHTRAIQELKKNDEKIVDYLRQPVPVGIGRLYQRAETTDPSAYRQPADVPADSVSAASKGGTIGQ